MFFFFLSLSQHRFLPFLIPYTFFFSLEMSLATYLIFVFPPPSIYIHFFLSLRIVLHGSLNSVAESSFAEVEINTLWKKKINTFCLEKRSGGRKQQQQSVLSDKRLWAGDCVDVFFFFFLQSLKSIFSPNKVNLDLLLSRTSVPIHVHNSVLNNIGLLILLNEFKSK